MSRTKQIAKEITALEQVFLRHIYHSILKNIDVPPSQLVALVAVCERKRCCFSDVSRLMHVSNPTVTGLIDRLEKSGYVKRVPCKCDRRVTNITPTKKGEAMAKTFLKNVQKKWESLITKLPNKDQENWLRIFKNIIEGLENEES